MDFRVEKYEKYAIATLEEGMLNVSIASDVKTEFAKMKTEGVKNLILDLSKVKYVDSSGLGSLLTANRIFSDEGAFVVINDSEHVKKLVSLSRLDDVLNILPTKEEAVDLVFMIEIEQGGDAKEL